MSWLAAFGQGGQQGMQSYEQSRGDRLDRERQARLDEQQRKLQALNEQSLQMSITGQKRNQFLDAFGPGSELDETGMAAAREAGLGSFVRGIGSARPRREDEGDIEGEGLGIDILNHMGAAVDPTGRNKFMGTHQQVQQQGDRERAIAMQEIQRMAAEMGLKTGQQGLERGEFELGRDRAEEDRRTSFLNGGFDAQAGAEQNMMRAIMGGLPDYAQAFAPILQSQTSRDVAKTNAGASYAQVQAQREGRTGDQRTDLIQRIIGNYVNGMTQLGPPTYDDEGNIISRGANPLTAPGFDIEDLIQKALRAQTGGVMPNLSGFGGGRPQQQPRSPFQLGGGGMFDR